MSIEGTVGFRAAPGGILIACHNHRIAPLLAGIETAVPVDS
jgi:hypothetical protein